jgi:Vacuolar sorting 38 and autophagy-related subunit 14
MQCDICFRTGGSRLPFLCPTDARNRLYEPRIQNARVLLEKDALDQQISTLLTRQPKPSGQQSHSLEGPAKGPNLAAILAEKDQAVDRTQQIITQADELRAKVENAREEIAKKKALLSRRKSDLASASNGVDSRRTRQVEDVEKGIRMIKYKWNQGHATTASSRAFLCGEAAKLYGLKRSRKNSGLEEYKIGGISIVDLRTMNSKFVACLVRDILIHLLQLRVRHRSQQPFPISCIS